MLQKTDLLRQCLSMATFIALSLSIASADEPARVYHNRLTVLRDAKPLLGDFPEFIQPIEEVRRYEAPILVDDEGADLSVRAWRFSYNARGIIEMPNRLRADRTAVIMVHPWGIDDGQGWRTPEPAGTCDFCTPKKNHLAARHTRAVDRGCPSGDTVATCRWAAVLGTEEKTSSALTPQ